MGNQMNTSPLVSVITPSLNQDRFIEQTILSVRNQDYPNVEHIVVDGGSTDSTLNILEMHEKEYDLRWVSEPDTGLSDAVNKGFAKAKGEIISWLNSDDAYLSTRTLSDVVEFFREHKEAKVLYGDQVRIDHRNTVLLVAPALPIYRYSVLERGNFIFEPSAFFRREIIAKHRLNDQLHYVMDYEYWLRIGRDHRFHHMPQVLSCFRLHNANKSVSQSHEMEREHRKIRPKKPNLLITAILSVLPVFGLPQALRLYGRSDFAFTLRLPPIGDLIVRNLLLGALLQRIRASG